MDFYVLSHCSDAEVLRVARTRRAGERGAIAQTLAAIGEVEDRELYVPAGYPSLFAYLTGELGYSEDEAGKRLYAARTARDFADLVFPALADGRLHLSALVLLGPKLTPGNAADLLAAAAGRTKSQIAMLIAERFPRPDVRNFIRALPAPDPSGGSHVPEHAAAGAPSIATGSVSGTLLDTAALVATGAVTEAPPQVSHSVHVPEHVPARRDRVTPLSAKSYAMQLTLRQTTHDKLRRAQELLGHRIASGDLDAVLERALDALIAKLEKRKFAATDKPRAAKGSKNPRQIPGAVKRQVWKRDGGRCTYVGVNGHRCTERGGRVEFDHILEVARGGKATASNLRLRCRTHNQYAAELAFGAGFMDQKRREAAGAHARTAGTCAQAAAGPP